ncbi:glycoside hydrolase family 3 N-terminal domain-containing protein [Streptomyces sp. NRRL B-24484]|uniref:glycoside hydrolase family 3 N-terminal domain-containing protein n=1 Tax=Streptomyces sp. NRRL B-24484 TaxID=1463833 RepID=UPI000AFF8221|nr:glycoside hydrolase family 3 N-terminal domain-containing protein [Streptomyces sp. NRRL B-24484]
MSSHARWLIVSLVMLMAACATAPRTGAGQSSAAARPQSPSAPGTGSARVSPSQPPSSGSADSAEPTWRTLTPPASGPVTDEQLAGQRIVYSYPGPVVPESVLAAVRGGRAAGVIFFAENIPDTATLRTAVERLREAQGQSPVTAPLLLMTDQEGGKVRRLPGAPELSAREVGESADAVAVAARTGAEAGKNLAAAGLNVNLAPVLDVYGTPGNFIDAKHRSYGQDPAAVADLAAAFAVAQRQEGVAATVKHFPGLGTAPAGMNTDAGPVSLPVPLERLRSVEEAPYRAALAVGVPLVMLSWAVYPALDAERPAGLSPTVVQGELRERLGFRGVTVTDALEAGALNGFGGTGERAVAAAAAGMDLVLCSARDARQGDLAAQALAGALADGRLDRVGFTTATARIATLRGALH